MSATRTALLALTLLATGLSAAPAAPLACSARLASVSAAWTTVGYSPQKPMQAHVLGAGGHQTSGPEVTQMRTAIRAAAADCQSGKDAAALARLAPVERQLASHH